MRYHCRKNIRAVKNLRETKRRLKKKVQNLRSLLTDLENKDLISPEISVLLQNSGGCCENLLQRQVQKLNGQSVKRNFSPKLRAFALTLNFLSPKAYKYVRSVFDTALPHPRTIRKWYESVDGSPGFTVEAFNALKHAATNTPHPILCSLLMDEIDIKRGIHFDGKNTYGYVNLGNDVLSETGDEAKQALVFMIVAINDSWKLPVAYFLVNGLNGSQKAELIQECIKKVEACNLIVTSLTFDGAKSNISMARLLGCDLSISETKPYFEINDHKIFVFYDACHMIKLIRNALGVLRILNVTGGSQIRWCYIEDLHKQQEREGLHLANKLRQAHVNFKKQIMKVKLASQVFSDSVADALEFCNETLKLKNFEGSEETVKFIRIINTTFDILNSHSIVAPRFKKAICEENYNDVSEFVTNAIPYLKSINFENRNTGQIGLIIGLTNALDMFRVINKINFFLDYSN